MNGRPPIKSLRALVGELIIVRSASLCLDDMTRVRLHRVEPEGIWIESQAFTDETMKRCNIATSETTLLQFVPFARIDYIVGSFPGVSLSEEAFGISEQREPEERGNHGNETEAQ
jgi:hypothetical protein